MDMETKILFKKYFPTEKKILFKRKGRKKNSIKKEKQLSVVVHDFNPSKRRQRKADLLSSRPA